MNFKEWCRKIYGITYFSEGEIVDRVILPAYQQSSIRINKLIDDYRGYTINHNGHPGLVFTQKNYDLLIKNLRDEYSHGHPDSINESHFERWKNNYFYSMGVDATRKSEYRTYPNMHVTIESEEKEKNFIDYFSRFYPRMSENSITGFLSVEMPPYFLYELYNRYHQYRQANNHNTTDIYSMKMHRNELQNLLDDIQRNSLYQRLDTAQILSLDYENSHHYKNFEAASAYAISLKTYAVLNQDYLSPQQYTDLLYASQALAHYDTQDNLQQSLKTDANFIDYIKNGVYFAYLDEYPASPHEGNPLIRDLPRHKSKQLRDLIDTNAYNILTGAQKVSLGKGKTFKMQRFLPDHNMKSETNVIMLQAGGVNGHSAMFEIIKVGRLANGELAGEHQTPLYYDYYKVEHDLGFGCHDADTEANTCLGTYVTKLEPFTINDRGEFILDPVDPCQAPIHYQQSMAFTIQELIKAEREILFYRPPGHNSKDSPIGIKEEKEWTRLNSLKKQLSGKPHHEPIEYFAPHPSDQSKRYKRTIQNQKGYMQKSGSCTIFSIKSLVSSMIGHELTTLHADYMQTHNGSAYAADLKMRIMSLDHCINALQIPVKNAHLHQWINGFTKYLGRQGRIEGLFIASSHQPDEAIICITDPYLKMQWNCYIDNYKRQQASVYSASISPVSFFNATPSSPGLSMLQKMELPCADCITMAMLAKDAYKPGQNVIKLICATPSDTEKLCDIIENLTTRTPKISISNEGYLILGENRFKALCKKLEINDKKIMASLPREESMTHNTSYSHRYSGN